jgi:hypothetical protein
MGLLSKLTSIRARRNVWAPLPRDSNLWWRQRSQMELLHDGKQWRIVGAGSERARIAFAKLDGDRLVYTLDSKEVFTGSSK